MQSKNVLAAPNYRRRCRGMEKEWKKSIASAQAWHLVAHIRPATRMLARTKIMRCVLGGTLNNALVKSGIK
jgi:hypothetical protein